MTIYKKRALYECDFHKHHKLLKVLTIADAYSIKI